MRRLRIVVAILFLPAILAAQGLPIKSGASTDLATVDTNKNMRHAIGASTRATYVASMGSQITTTAYTLTIESGVSLGFKLSRVCVGVSAVTAAAGVTITINRRTTASTGGTALTSEGTSSLAISKMDPADASYSGIARNGGTLGTVGATLGQFGFTVGEIGAGAADPPSLPVFCRDFGLAGEKMPTVSAGVANGLSIAVTAPGAGGLTAGSIDAIIISE